MTDQQQTVLIVDDERFNIDILVEILKDSYRVLVAKSGQQALSRIESGACPDLILLDIIMPEMDGYAVLDNIKNNEKTNRIPVIFISAKTEVAEEAYGLSQGAVDYITKPFHAEVVKARVDTHLQLKRNRDLLTDLASLDALTGIANRRQFDTVLNAEWRRLARSRKPLSLIMIDIDCFKTYNDRYGHAAGDECLKTVAQTLAEAVGRPGDLACRYGGEEFAVILPETDAQGARVLAERMRHSIEALSIEHNGNIATNIVTISCGVASIEPTIESAQISLVELADKMLYQAKNSGRNCVEIAET